MKFFTSKRGDYTVIHNSTKLASAINQKPKFFAQLLSNMLYAKIIHNRDTDSFVYSTNISHKDLKKAFNVFKIECS